MFEIFLKINKLFNKRKKITLIIMAMLSIIASLFEAYALYLLVPLSGVFLNTISIDSVVFIRILTSLVYIESNQIKLIIFLIYFIIIYILKGIFRVFVIAIQNKFIYNTKAEYQTQLVENAIYKPYSYYAVASSSEMLRICVNDIDQCFLMVVSVNNFITELISFFVFVIGGILIDVKITICFGFLIFIEMMFINKTFRNYYKICSKQVQKYGSELMKCITQFFHGIKDVKVNVKEQFFIDTFNHSAVLSAHYVKWMQVITGAIPVIFEVGTVVVVGILCLIGVCLKIDFIKMLPNLVSMAAFGIKIMQSANRLSNLYAGVNQYIASLDVVIKSMNDVNIDKDLFNIKKDIKAMDFNNSCDIVDVTYKYPLGKESVIINSNLKVPVGKSVGIVGASGGGKTTTIDLLLGLYDPDTGVVLVDGVDIKNKKKEWLQNIAYVPQNIYMLDDSIKANVAFGEKDEDIDNDKVICALKEASLYDFVNNLKDGINERVGENGIRLSGGQKQRIGIARALYKNPKLIVFDEATSALDNDTEKEIMKTINGLQGSRTIIIVAHRLTTIENCDIVYKIENQKIERVK